MVYIFQGELLCKSCGLELIEALKAEGRDPKECDVGCSEGWPQPWEGGESDSPHHCGTMGECLEPEALDDGTTVPRLLTEELTSDGKAYVARAHHEGPNALTRLWLDRFDIEDPDDD